VTCAKLKRMQIAVLEMLTYQAEEIESARLKAGEDEELRKERDRLANAESLAQNAQEALLFWKKARLKLPPQPT
jgi:DNA repair ATPase RecN